MAGLRERALDICRGAVFFNSRSESVDEGGIFADASEVCELATGRADAFQRRRLLELNQY